MDDPRTSMILGLASGLLAPVQGNRGFGAALSQGLLSGMQGYQQGAQMQDQRAYRQAAMEAQKQQMDMQRQRMSQDAEEFKFRQDDRAAQQQKDAAAQAREAARNAYLQEVAAGMRPINAAEAFSLGLSTDQAKALAESGNWGRPVVKTWKQVRGQDGKVIEIGLDEFGQPVQGAQQTPFIEPKPLDLGGRVTMFDPTAVQPGQQFDKTMTPGEAANNRIAQGNLGVAQARLGLERQRFAADQAQNGAGAPLVFNAEVGGYIPKQLSPGQTPTVVALPGGTAGKPPTEFQARNAQYAAMMREAESILTPMETDPKGARGAPNMRTAAAGSIPLVGGFAERVVMSKDQQRYRQAQETWVRAKLRLESGAAIGKEEMEREISTYFPMVGDSPETVAQKRAMRQQAIAGMTGVAGPANRVVPIASQQGVGTGSVSGQIGGQQAPRVLMFDAQGNMIGGR